MLSFLLMVQLGQNARLAKDVLELGGDEEDLKLLEDVEDSGDEDVLEGKGTSKESEVMQFC